ncbi:MAG: 4-alpha-glucanotransferase [Methylophilaceae bacterium]
MKVSNIHRQAGVLLHISSLPLGALGPSAYQFVDFLHQVGATVWQTLPLNMPHADGSPYQCLSAHAGNPAFISMKILVDEKLLSAEDLTIYMTNRSPELKQKLIEKIFIALSKQPQSPQYLAFKKFCRKHASWLDDFALFLLLRKQFENVSWNKWPDVYKKRDAKALNQIKKLYQDEIDEIKFTQFLFFQQWASLKAYANQKGVAMFGDVPIFVAYDSADVWANPELFKLDKRCNMKVVAGVPPDYFSATGQHWGNPHYNWQAMKADGFKWWLARMATQNSFFDMVRIDHFRGLQAAWEIPANEETAINGKWKLAPGAALLEAITKRFPRMCLVAEDLGLITPQVNALRAKFKLPGMKILQFAFGSGDDNYYLPSNIEANSVVYTGTHDNHTTVGWYNTIEPHAKQHLHAVLAKDNPKIPADLVQMALATKANLAIIPMQDILGLDGSHRMNTPGTMENNWRWHFSWPQLTLELVAQFAQAIKATGRVQVKK